MFLLISCFTVILLPFCITKLIEFYILPHPSRADTRLSVTLPLRGILCLLSPPLRPLCVMGSEQGKKKAHEGRWEAEREEERFQASYF